jgi:hypothetical protein
MLINAILTIYNSKRDYYGNRYFAVYLSDADTFETAQGQISAENISTLECRENLKWRVQRVELPIRQYNRLVKGWPHLGCHWEEIRDRLQAQLTTQKETASHG